MRVRTAQVANWLTLRPGRHCQELRISRLTDEPLEITSYPDDAHHRLVQSDGLLQGQPRAETLFCKVGFLR